MPSADRLVEFVAIVDHGSIAAAGRHLGLPRATLSRRLAGLEDALGVRLLHRKTRRLDLTHAGQVLLTRARCLIEDTTAAWQAVARLDDTPRGRLRVSLPPTRFFEELLTGFALRYAAVELEVTATTRHVDLRAEKVDVALRFGPVRDPGLIARRLWRDRVAPAAAPGYLDARGRPAVPDDLRGHDCILGYDAGWTRATRWPLRAGGFVVVDGRFVSDEAPLRLRAALDGLGVALLPEPVTAPYRRAGQLEAVLAADVGADVDATLVYPDRQHLPPQARAFIDHTVEHFRDGMGFDPRTLPPVGVG